MSYIIYQCLFFRSWSKGQHRSYYYMEGFLESDLLNTPNQRLPWFDVAWTKIPPFHTATSCPHNLNNYLLLEEEQSPKRGLLQKWRPTVYVHNLLLQDLGVILTNDITIFNLMKIICHTRMNPWLYSSQFSYRFRFAGLRCLSFPSKTRHTPLHINLSSHGDLLLCLFCFFFIN